LSKPDEYKRMFWVMVVVLGIPSLLWTGINAYNQHTLWQRAQELTARIEEVKDTQRQLTRTIKALNVEIRKEVNKHGSKKER
jgi:hypothetical protein